MRIINVLFIVLTVIATFTMNLISNTYDAEVTYVSASVNPKVGQPMEIIAGIKNKSTVMSSWYTKIIIREKRTWGSDPIVHEQWKLIDNIGIDEVKMQYFEWTPQESGTYYAVVEVWGWTLQHKHDERQSSDFTVQTDIYDAEVTYVSASVNPQAGQPMEIIAGIKNKSTVESSWYTKLIVKRKRSWPNSDLIVHEQGKYINNIGINQIKMQDFQWTPQESGTYYAIVEVWGYTQEYKHGERKSSDFTVADQFRVTSVEISVTPSNVYMGEDITRSINIGGTGSGTVHYRWEYRESDGNWQTSGSSFTTSMTNGNTNILPSIIPAYHYDGNVSYRVVVTSPNNYTSNVVPITVQARYDAEVTYVSTSVDPEVGQPMEIIAGIKNNSAVVSSWHTKLIVHEKRAGSSDFIVHEEWKEIHDIGIDDVKMQYFEWTPQEAGTYYAVVEVWGWTLVHMHDEQQSGDFEVFKEGGKLYIEVNPNYDMVKNVNDAIEYEILVTDNTGNPVEGSKISGHDHLQSLSYLPIFTDNNGRAIYTTIVPEYNSEGSYSVTFIASKAGYKHSDLITRSILFTQDQIGVSPIIITQDNLPFITEGYLRYDELFNQYVETNNGGLKFEISGIGNYVVAGEQYMLTIKSEPGTNIQDLFPDHTVIQKILGQEASQIIIHYNHEDVAIGNPIIFVDGKTVAQHWSEGIAKGLVAVAMLVSAPTGGWGGLLYSLIKDLVLKGIDKIAQTGISYAFEDIQPGTDIQINHSIDLGTGDEFTELVWLLGNPDKTLTQLHHAHMVEMKMPITFNEAGKYSFSIHPDIRFQNTMISNHVLTSAITATSYLQYRQHITLNVSVLDPELFKLVSPNYFNFGNLSINEIDFQEITFSNPPDADNNLELVINLEGDSYLIDGEESWALALAPGDQAEFQIEFSPKLIGDNHGMLIIEHNNNDYESPITVPLRGKGTGEPQISFSEPGLFFEDAIIGESHYKLLKIFNEINATNILVGTIHIEGEDFYIQNDSWLFALRPGQYISIPIEFIPVSEGLHNAELIIEHNAPNEPQVVNLDLFGNGVLKNEELSAPQLVSPLNGAEYVTLNADLVWESINGAGYYQIQIGNDIYTSGEESFNIGGWEEKTEYFWRVRALNEGGSSTWSSVWSFTTGIDYEDDPRRADSLALVALYNNTEGNNWHDNANWLSDEPLSTWYGVTLKDNRVSRLELSLNNLNGQLPNDIGDLEKLEMMSLAGNKISGEIPASIGKLSNLSELDLGFNNISGEIPTEIGLLNNLVQLILGSNSLIGEIPSEIGNLSKLIMLSLNNNDLTGNVPQSIGNLTNLRYLYIDGNSLKGSIPSTITNLVNLEILYINDNSFTHLPNLSELVNLNELSISNNHLCFDSIEPNINVAESIWYAPQARFGEERLEEIALGEQITISFEVGGDNNVYQWFKDNQAIPGAESDTYTIESMTHLDAGVYVLHITNTVATDLILYSEPVILQAGVLDDSYWTIYNTFNSDIPSNTIESILLIDDNNLWLATTPTPDSEWNWHGGGLVNFDGKNWTVYTATNSDLPNNFVRTLASDANNNLWVGTDGGLVKINGNNWTIYNKDNSVLPSNRVTALAIENGNNLWIGFDAKVGTVKYEGQDWTVFNTLNSGLPDDQVISIAVDNDGNKWFGTLFGGIAKYDGNNWTVFNTSNSNIPSNFIRSIAVDVNGNIWTGNTPEWVDQNQIGGGLGYYDGNTWTVYNTDNSDIPSNNVWSVSIDNNDDLWVGTAPRWDGSTWLDGGLAYFDRNGWKVYTTSNSGLPSNWIMSIAIRDENSRWIGTNWGGLAFFSDLESLPPDIPGRPVLISPINNETGVGTSPRLRWHRNQHATSYHIQVTDNNGFFINIEGIPDTSYHAQNLDYATQHEWKVRAHNQAGYSDWSETFSFTTIGAPVVEETKEAPAGDNSVVTYDNDYQFAGDVQTSSQITIQIFYEPPYPGENPPGVLQVGDMYVVMSGGEELDFTNAYLRIPLDQLPAGFDPEDLTMLKRTASGDGWEDLGGTVDNGHFVNTIPFHSFSEFSLGVTGVLSLPATASAGWNLVGLPLKVFNDHYKSLFPNAIDGTLYSFEGTYKPETIMEPGTGYWLRFNADETLEITGLTVDELTLSLIAGWNMISGLSSTVPLAEVNDPDGIIIQGTLYEFVGTYNPSTAIHPGKGYWIRANADGEIGLSSGAGVPGSLAKTATGDGTQLISALEVFDRIEIQDASGMERLVYFGSTLPEEIQRESFSLPPVPPGGAFDARFSDGYYLSESNEATILLQGESYPLSLTFYSSSVDETIEYIVTEKDGVEHRVITGESIELTDPDVRMVLIQRVGGVAEKLLPKEFSLYQNYPNPFNPSTTIEYALPKDSYVTLEVYNMLGQRVEVLVNEEQQAGYHRVVFDATKLPSGVYVYRIKAQDFVDVKKLVFLK